LVIPFVNAADTFATVKIIPPRNYDNGTITVVVHWTAVVNGTGNVIWGISGVAVGDADDLTAAGTDYGTEVLTTAQATTNIGITELSARTAVITIANSPADGDAIYLRVSRDGGNASDTFDQSVHLLGISVAFNTNAAVAA